MGRIASLYGKRCAIISFFDTYFSLECVECLEGTVWLILHLFKRLDNIYPLLCKGLENEETKRQWLGYFWTDTLWFKSLSLTWIWVLPPIDDMLSDSLV